MMPRAFHASADDAAQQLGLRIQEQVVGEQRADAEDEILQRVARGLAGVAIDLLEQDQSQQRGRQTRARQQQSGGSDLRRRELRAAAAPAAPSSASTERSTRASDQRPRGAAAAGDRAQREQPGAVAQRSRRGRCSSIGTWPANALPASSSAQSAVIDAGGDEVRHPAARPRQLIISSTVSSRKLQRAMP